MQILNKSSNHLTFDLNNFFEIDKKKKKKELQFYFYVLIRVDTDLNNREYLDRKRRLSNYFRILKKKKIFESIIFLSI